MQKLTKREIEAIAAVIARTAEWASEEEQHYAEEGVTKLIKGE